VPSDDPCGRSLGGYQETLPCYPRHPQQPPWIVSQ
jgi:hypothetical protein